MKIITNIRLIAFLILFLIFSVNYNFSQESDKWKVLEFPYENMMDDHVKKIADEFNINKNLPANSFEFEIYKENLIKNLWKAFGWKPEKKTDLHARITGKTDMGDYIIEKLLFESMPGVYVTANVYVPKNVPFPAPAILCPHGHWDTGTFHPVVQSRCIGLAKLGYIVLIPDKWGYGEREYTDHHDTYFLYPTGITLEGLQIWDNMRAVDYLLSRDDVDSERIGITGASGGGNQTMYTGCLDPRIKVVIPTASMCTFKGLFFRGIGCVCENTPNILRFADLWDVSIATAPKPLLYNNTVLDPIFPISAAREAFYETKKIYNMLGIEDKIRKVETFAKHDYNKSQREATYGWFDHWLKNMPGYHTEEPEFGTLPGRAEPLKVLSSKTELQSPETLLSLNYKIAKNLPPKIEMSSQRQWDRSKTFCAFSIDKYSVFISLGMNCHKFGCHHNIISSLTYNMSS